MGKKYFELKYKGELVQMKRNDDGNYIITRILSTNPYAYLREELQPGKIVKSVPKEEVLK